MAVGHADQRLPAVERHDVGLIVVGPVADVIATLGGEVIERVPGLLQAGAEPAARPRAGRLLDGRERVLDDARLFARRRRVEAAGIAFAMAHPFPAPLVAFLDDRGVLGAKLAVERDRGADAVAVEHLHQAEHADPVAVVARRPGRNVGHRHAGAAGAGRHFLVEARKTRCSVSPTARHGRRSAISAAGDG